MQYHPLLLFVSFSGQLETFNQQEFCFTRVRPDATIHTSECAFQRVQPGMSTIRASGRTWLYVRTHIPEGTRRVHHYSHVRKHVTLGPDSKLSRDKKSENLPNNGSSLLPFMQLDMRSDASPYASGCISILFQKLDIVWSPVGESYRYTIYTICSLSLSISPNFSLLRAFCLSFSHFNLFCI